jgi:hypothetical protein
MSTGWSRTWCYMVAERLVCIVIHVRALSHPSDSLDPGYDQAGVIPPRLRRREHMNSSAKEAPPVTRAPLSNEPQRGLSHNRFAKRADDKA